MTTAILAASPKKRSWRPDKAYKEAQWVTSEFMKIPRARRGKVLAHVIQMVTIFINARAERKINQDKGPFGLRPGER